MEIILNTKTRLRVLATVLFTDIQLDATDLTLVVVFTCTFVKIRLSETRRTQNCHKLLKQLASKLVDKKS